MSQQQHNQTVQRGMGVGFVITLSLFTGLYMVVPKVSQEMLLVDRITLGLECLVFPALILLVTIFSCS